MQRLHNIRVLLNEYAQKSDMDYHYACIITFGDKIISIGYNKYRQKKVSKTHCKKRKNSGYYSRHAEEDALIKVPKSINLKKCNIYIGKVVNGQVVQGYPCKMCMRFLKSRGVECINKID